MAVLCGWYALGTEEPNAAAIYQGSCCTPIDLGELFAVSTSHSIPSWIPSLRIASWQGWVRVLAEECVEMVHSCRVVTGGLVCGCVGKSTVSIEVAVIESSFIY